MKSLALFLIEQPFGNLGDWTTSYGGEDKQAIISKEESREIVKSLSLKPFESVFKIMIIWQPEYMHPSAANGIFENCGKSRLPIRSSFWSRTIRSRLLPTILSRTQHIMVPMLQDEELESFLRTQPALDERKRQQIVAEAEAIPGWHWP